MLPCFSNTGINPVEDPFVLFRISFWYYNAVGAIVTILIGLIVSWFTKRNDHSVHPDLISPVVRRWMSKEKQSGPSDYFSVEKVLEMVAHNTKENESTAK